MSKHKGCIVVVCLIWLFIGLAAYFRSRIGEREIYDFQYNSLSSLAKSQPGIRPMIREALADEVVTEEELDRIEIEAAKLQLRDAIKE